MKKYTIATAEYKTFTDKYAAKAYLKKVNFPIVIKANGLAAGKGVVICHKLIEANKCVDEMMVEKKFKDAGNSIVIEEFLKGVEASIVCVTDGKTIVPLISSQDHKAIYDGNKGPNTGGMGAICPNQHLTKEIMDDFVKNIMLPTLKGTQKEKMDFHGFIFFGVMITSKGCKCLEYNVRLGDPETQSILPLMHFDFLKMIQFTLKNQLNKFKFK
jgi:phosphoribosylamine--glycine ligase